MATIDIVVTDLTFPADLDDKYCKFRPLISIRYRDSHDAITYAREALPGLGPRDYWECEKGNKNKAGYVRHDTLPKVDTENKLDISKREIIFRDLDVKTLERVEVELFDIDIKTGLEKLGEAVLKLLPEVALPFINPAFPLTLMALKSALENGTGKKLVDLETGLIDKALGKEDGAARSIWARSKDLTNAPAQTSTITGMGTKGNYSITLKIEVS